MPRPHAPAAASAVTGEVLEVFLRGTDRAVVLDSPPGAGKSTFVVSCALELLGAYGGPVPIVAQTNTQADDLVARLADRAAEQGLSVGRLHSADHTVPPELANAAQVRCAQRITDVDGCDIVVATAAKWSYLPVSDTPRHFTAALVDEAYQMRSDALLKIGHLFDRALFVGDPGQLDPFSTVDVSRWAYQANSPVVSAVTTVLTHHPDTPVRRLPVSWRLPESAADLVARAFYPGHPFTSGTLASERRLTLNRAGVGEPADEALDTAATTGWAWVELPARWTGRDDAQVAATVVACVRRLLERGATTYSEAAPEGRPLTADRLAIGVVHRSQRDAVRSALAAVDAPGLGLEQVTVDTANRLQGREYDVTIVWHPLSGRRDATEFHLEAGRLCVLLSRHRHACLVVGRAGITELLDAHPGAVPVHLGPAPAPLDGWAAHHAVLDELAAHRVR